MKPSTIRPGLLVALKTNVVGNINYHKRDLGAKVDKKTGAEIVEWETTRTISDPKEFKAASQVRMKCRGLIQNVCANSSFGLLCPENKADELAAAIKKAQALADKFNKDADCTRVNVNVIAGRVASDDVEATKAINGEVRELLDRMEQGVKKLDVKAIRDAANRAKALSGIVAPGTDERLKAAVDAARDAARKLVKAGETAAKEVDQEALKTLKASRTAFLDIDFSPPSGEETDAKPSRAKAKKRALDLAAD
jgi:hypothetical protein